MANRAFIIPTRNDLDGSLLQVVDLNPNTSQKNSIYDGIGQTGYFKYVLDQPGTTVVSGNAYVSGSKNTSSLSSTSVVDTDSNASNDSTITSAANFGLLAYLRDRVHVNPGGDSDFLTSGEALNIANDIVALVMAGSDVTLAAINTIINARVAGSDSDLNGVVTSSHSFGSVEDILRILSGEVYRVNANTILGDQTGAFASLSARQALVAAATSTYYASGDYIARDESGFQDVLIRNQNTAVNVSATTGALYQLATRSLTLTNPNFAYTAGDVRTWKPRAVQLDGTAVPATGTTTGVLRVYNGAGIKLA